MPSRLLSHVRSNTVAYLALFCALGGTSYAAFRLPPNSVGNAQLKRNAVTASKVKDHSLLARDFRGGHLPAGPAGPPGPTTPATIGYGSIGNPQLANQAVDGRVLGGHWITAGPFTDSGGSVVFGSALCNPGERVISGSHDMYTSDPGWHLVESVPSGPVGGEHYWYVELNEGAAVAHNLYIHAYCL